MAVFNIVGGHSTASQGASGYINEVTEDRKVKDALISILKDNGHTAIDCSSNASNASTVLKEQVNSCNKHSGVDVHIHFNSYNGSAKGTEVLVYSTTSKSNPYASRVCSNLCALGFKNRGVKVRSDLYVLRKSTNPALIIEVCFVDNADDVAIYNKVGVQKIAEQIAKGLLNVSSLKTNTPTPTNASYYPKYTGSSLSILTALQSVGEKDTSLKHRGVIAKANGINDYKGSYNQNVTMLGLLKKGTLKRG